MGFTAEYGGQSIVANPQSVTGSDAIDSSAATAHHNNVGGNDDDDDDCGGGNSSFKRLPDQEILDGMEEIYFQEEANCEQYELEVI